MRLLRRNRGWYGLVVICTRPTVMLKEKCTMGLWLRHTLVKALNTRLITNSARLQ